jgi:murein DD-endopeptidase MepM/ murein hydrolase activator NlpD
MFRRLLPLAAGLTLAALPAPALAQSGGAAAPPSEGGTAFGQAIKKGPRLRTTVFAVSARSVQLGQRLRFTWRVDGRVRRVRARVAMAPAAGGPGLSIPLGTRRTGTRNTRTWTARNVAAGRYTARLLVSGATLRRTARASGLAAVDIVEPPPPPPPPVVAGLFPVQGAYDFGGPDARFGARRSGHVHQGQDVMAAEGTPVVTPVAGFVYWRAYQASGAGHYVVIRGDDGRDYAFMHFQDGSVLVTKGQRVAAGQRLASVGATGDAQGSHLHFEIWPDGWYANAASHPIDPLPDLLSWAAA